ncbi:MAG: N-acetylmuramoyl-L-alanine amidase [Candidatus Omnitrophota bacterium]
MLRRKIRRFFCSSVFLFLTMLALSSCAKAPVNLPIGQTPVDYIYRPSAGTAAYRHDMVHVIAPAETVYRISKMYDVPVAAILEANQIKDPRKMKVGQKLVIPQGAPLRPVIPVFKTKKWKYIVVHHSVTEAGDARSLDLIHRKRGFNRGLGYHFVIDNGTNTKVDGQIESSARWIKQLDGAHCSAGGMNKCAIGICLVGDFTSSEPTAGQMESLVLLVNTLKDYYHMPSSRVLRHKDVPGAKTECPGKSFPWYEFKARLKRD